MKIEFLQPAGIYENEATNIKKSSPYKLYAYLDAFIESEAPFAVFEDWQSEYASLYSVRNTVMAAIRRTGLESKINCVSTNGAVMLIRVED